MDPLSSSQRLLALVVCGAIALAAVYAVKRVQPAASATKRGTLTFAASVTPAERGAILASIGRARPAARELIAREAGDVTVRVGQTGGTTVGLTEGVPGDWTVTLDFDAVLRRYGERGMDRVVLHEFGHVVDFASLSTAQRAAFDAGVPRGWGCDEGNSGACADRAERFAESFAKWATDDLGIDLSIGYKVPPPSAGLDAWGLPLTTLAARR